MLGRRCRTSGVTGAAGHARGVSEDVITGTRQLREHRAALDRCARALLERETLDDEAIRALAPELWGTAPLSRAA